MRLLGLGIATAILLSAAPALATTRAERSAAHQLRTIEGARAVERFSAAARRSAYDRSRRVAYTLAGRRLVARPRSGGLRTVIDLRPAGVRRPRGITIARSGDRTDARRVRHVYVVERDRVVEIGFEVRAVPASAAAVARVVAPLLRTVETSAWSPASPDPSGITFDAANSRFIVADSEVEEMGIYQGANLWTVPVGSLQGTGSGTTTRFSKEPTGISLDPGSRTLYVSDDDGDRIIVDRPGPDGRHGTADDVTTRVSAAAYGIGDAEDVAYDTRNGHLFVCDGTGREIWEIDPVNGVFGDAGDAVTHFDLAVHGMRDCEGVAIDKARDTLVVVEPTQKFAYEFTRSGNLSRILDMRQIALSNVRLAAIVLAPSSSLTDHPSVLSYWVTDRRVDNGENANENDGRMYELGIPGAAPSDSPPSAGVTAPAAGASVSGTVTASASASDDVGVTQVRFRVDGSDIGADTNGADGWSVAWDTLTVGNGTHALTAVATDTAGNTSVSAPVSVTVANVLQGTVTVPVRTGNDDGDEISDGTVRRTNGDLELGSDHGVATTVALRFSGLEVPRNATIERATVQFNADELDRAAATLAIRAHAADHSAALAGTAFNLSSRPATTGAVTWSVPTWTVFGAAGPEQRTPDVGAVIEEVVERPGWVAGNALTLLITGSGRRTAESFEGGFPAVLVVEFT